MRLYLAMSCLQGRPMDGAFDELCALEPDGVQLTPGNAPTVDFMGHVERSGVSVRTHHGFSPMTMRAQVWSAEGALMGNWHSVHPPQRVAPDWLPSSDTSVCLEVMYPGLALGSGAAVEAAMDRGCTLAVDVSHINIQREQGEMSGATWRRLQDYERIAEIHLSANDGRRDRHQDLARDTFGLGWARERSAASDIPVILECYMHRLSHDDRRRQIDYARGTHG